MLLVYEFGSRVIDVFLIKFFVVVVPFLFMPLVGDYSQVGLIVHYLLEDTTRKRQTFLSFSNRKFRALKSLDQAGSYMFLHNDKKSL